jgi:hypothetical protein
MFWIPGNGSSVLGNWKSTNSENEDGWFERKITDAAWENPEVVAIRVCSSFGVGFSYGASGADHANHAGKFVFDGL